MRLPLVLAFTWTLIHSVNGAPPSLPSGAGLVMVMTGQMMSTVSARTPVQPFESVAVTTNAKLPSAVGVPVTLPAPFIERPVGNAPPVTA